MIFRRIEQRIERVSPYKGYTLFLVAIILSILILPICFLYGVIEGLFIKRIGTYLLSIAKSIDQLGNVTSQHAFNILFINGRGYKFGDPDETISSVLGKNKELDRLTKLGTLLVYILDKLDPNHTLDSIDYFTNYSHKEIDLPTLKEKLSDKFPQIDFSNISMISRNGTPLS